MPVSEAYISIILLLCRVLVVAFAMPASAFAFSEDDLAKLHTGSCTSCDLVGIELTLQDLGGYNLENADLSRAELAGANLTGAKLYRAILVEAKLDSAILIDAKLINADLRKASLYNALLTGANLLRADAREANFGLSDLTGARLNETDLRGADMSGANLTGATLRDTKLEGALFTNVNLTDAVYSPISAPDISYLSGISGLATVHFAYRQHDGLVQLRALLRETGLRDLERQATYAIEHGKTAHALDGYGIESTYDGRGDLEQKDVSAVIEGVFRLVFFEWTTGYGLNFGRPIMLLAALVGIMTLVYLQPVSATDGIPSGSGIYRIWPKERIEDTENGVEVRDDIRVERLSEKGLMVVVYAFYFSLLSAFQIGWRDLNVGNWLTRLQSREYVFRARGWVRVVSGIQSLISVYLLAMWALTYFGRPFD